VQYGSSPENVDKLNAAVMTELDRLRKDGPTAADLQIVKEADKNDLVQALRQNAYWLNALQSAHILGRDPKMIPRAPSAPTRSPWRTSTKRCGSICRPIATPSVTLMPEKQAARTQ
jgi:hypothetical protein